MNIYDYFRSPDIAAHCEKISHVFNPLEMAVIVALSMKPLKEKHSAWREIIKDCPDMPIRGSNCFKARESLHEYLRELIRCEERGLDEFYEDDGGRPYAIYRPFTVTSHQEHSEDMGLYWNADDAWEAIRDSSDNWLEDKISHARIYKDYVADRYQKGDLRGGHYRDVVWLNSDGNVTLCEGMYQHYLDWPDTLDNIFIHIPLPFEKGDLVEFAGTSCNDGPCVLRNLPHWKPSHYEKQLSGELSDGSDMIAWIYFMDEDGQLNFNDSPCFLYDLKHYTGEYKGYDRFLPYLSHFMKEGKENLDLLLYSYNKIKAITEYETRDGLLESEFQWWTKSIEEARTQREKSDDEGE